MRIDVWSDVVCPWCYLGKRRLDVALEGLDFADEVEVRWRAFQLDPTATVREVVLGDRPDHEWAAEVTTREVVEVLRARLHRMDDQLIAVVVDQEHEFEEAALRIGADREPASGSSSSSIGRDCRMCEAAWRTAASSIRSRR